MPARIPAGEGRDALATWRAHGEDTLRRDLYTAVRYTLQVLTEAHPGRAVEVRVPPCGAVQILTGTTHRRGTPPAVVEMSPATWLSLATGALTWTDAVASGAVQASGERADLAALLPLAP